MAQSKTIKNNFPIPNQLHELPASPETEQLRREVESDEELSGDEAVRKLTELEWEYRKSLTMGRDPIYMNLNRTSFKYFSKPRRILSTANRDLRRELKLAKASTNENQLTELSEECKGYLNIYLEYKKRIENGIGIIKRSRLNYLGIVAKIKQTVQNAHDHANQPGVPLRVLSRRRDHLQDNVHRVQCQVNVLLHDNRILMDQIRDQLVEFGNHAIQHREIKANFGRIRRDQFLLVDEANRNFEDFQVCLEKVQFLGKENEKQNHEFQNALWDAQRFHAYDLELDQFYRTKLSNRPTIDGKGGNRNKRYSLFHIYVCDQKIARYKTGLASLTKFPGGRDTGILAILYKELDLNCQADFARIIELDKEVNSAYRNLLVIQEKLEGVFKITKHEKHDRQLQIKKLQATSDTIELKIPQTSFELELDQNTAENVIDSVQNIFDIASAFEDSVLGLLGSKGNIITARNLEPAFHVLEHRISELLYMKAAYTLRKKVQIEGKPLPVIGAKRKSKAGSTTADGKRIGKPDSRGGFFRPTIFVGSAAQELDFGVGDLNTADAKKIFPYRDVRSMLEFEMSENTINEQVHHHVVISSPSESGTELSEIIAPEQVESQFLEPSRIISARSTIAGRDEIEEHSTHEAFFRESVQGISEAVAEQQAQDLHVPVPPPSRSSTGGGGAPT